MMALPQSMANPRDADLLRRIGLSQYAAAESLGRTEDEA